MSLNLKLFKYHIPLVFVLIIGSIIIYSLVDNYYKTENQKKLNLLNKVHNESIIKVETGINVYATVVSSIRSFLINSKEFPSEQDLQSYLFDLTKEINFKDSIVVSLIDTTHTFKYVVTPNKIDPNNLKGINTAELRPNWEIEKLNKMMRQDSIILFEPINLKEGWAAFPFNFALKDKNENTIGYVASVLNVNYLLNSFYEVGQNQFAHRFAIRDSVDITRYAVYDETKIYNSLKDDEYYKNFGLNPNDFKYTNLKFYGMDIKLGTAYKSFPKTNHSLAYFSYFWYTLLLVFTAVTLVQFVRNYTLNKRLKIAKSELEIKKSELEKNLSKIQTLIKEIHHRVKNNMQMISTLLLLQKDEYKDPKIIAALEKSRNRIQSMSLVHRKLYGSKNLEKINTKEYINQLISYIENTISDDSRLPIKNIHIPINLELDGETTVNLGLIINELITNSFKYAFKKNEKNELNISISTKENSIFLSYSDSGPGLPDNVDVMSSESLGLQLLKIFTEQLNGNLSYNRHEENEFRFEFRPISM